MTEEDMIHFQKITWCCISSWLYGDTLQWWWRLFETHIESCQFIGWWHHQIHKRTHLNNHHSLGRLDIIVLILKGLLELPFELLESASDRIQMILFLALTSVVRNQERYVLWERYGLTSTAQASDMNLMSYLLVLVATTKLLPRVSHLVKDAILYCLWSNWVNIVSWHSLGTLLEVLLNLRHYLR